MFEVQAAALRVQIAPDTSAVGSVTDVATLFSDAAIIDRVIGLIDTYNDDPFITSPLSAFMRQFRDVYIRDRIHAMNGGRS
ncbi:hypothetical protein NONI108955_11130 [Nocardia ninae]|uniref:Uncharacterized protein n=1 Tax=Nocardia ninae NBRC 108245 TaxID=1210091 RepID=A0A511MP81_9NOCA|nr:hypothetical protein [Nocardia ninae]GEM41947.1 hypothetical protein NN4_64660 [Nocardia ninae NBRC 108245]